MIGLRRRPVGPGIPAAAHKAFEDVALAGPFFLQQPFNPERQAWHSSGKKAAFSKLRSLVPARPALEQAKLSSRPVNEPHLAHAGLTVLRFQRNGMGSAVAGRQNLNNKVWRSVHGALLKDFGSLLPYEKQVRQAATIFAGPDGSARVGYLAEISCVGVPSVNPHELCEEPVFGKPCSHSLSNNPFG